jgi:hypothetical protein
MKTEALQKTAQRHGMTTEEVKTILPMGQKLVADLQNGREISYNDVEQKAIEVATTYNLFDDTLFEKEMAALPQ